MSGRELPIERVQVPFGRRRSLAKIRAPLYCRPAVRIGTWPALEITIQAMANTAIRGLRSELLAQRVRMLADGRHRPDPDLFATPADGGSHQLDRPSRAAGGDAP